MMQLTWCRDGSQSRSSKPIGAVITPQPWPSFIHGMSQKNISWQHQFNLTERLLCKATGPSLLSFFLFSSSPSSPSSVPSPGWRKDVIEVSSQLWEGQSEHSDPGGVEEHGKDTGRTWERHGKNMGWTTGEKDDWAKGLSRDSIHSTLSCCCLVPVLCQWKQYGHPLRHSPRFMREERERKVLSTTLIIIPAKI